MNNIRSLIRHSEDYRLGEINFLNLKFDKQDHNMSCQTNMESIEHKKLKFDTDSALVSSSI